MYVIELYNQYIFFIYNDCSNQKSFLCIDDDSKASNYPCHTVLIVIHVMLKVLLVFCDLIYWIHRGFVFVIQWIAKLVVCLSNGLYLKLILYKTHLGYNVYFIKFLNILRSKYVIIVYVYIMICSIINSITILLTMLCVFVVVWC